MRHIFKTALPVAQAVLAIALIASNPRAPFMSAVNEGYAEPIESPIGVAHFVEANLPAVPVVVSAYVLLGGHDPSADIQELVAAFALAGIGTWFFIGRFLDDVIAALRGRLIPRRHIADGLVSAFIVASSCVVFVESEIAKFALSMEKSALAAYSLCWIVLGCTLLLAQVGWAYKAHVHRRSFHAL